MNYIYIDLDGVLADFDKEAFKYPELTPRDACRTIKGFYINLELYPGAKEFVEALEIIYPDRVRFLSAVVIERPDSWTEKALWIEKHFPTLLDRLILTRTKEAVGAVGDILIDDHPTWNGADEFRGDVIQFNTGNIPVEYNRIINLLEREWPSW